MRGRAHRAHPHGLHAAARHRGRGGAARRAARRRRIAAAAEQAAEGTDPPGDLNATPDYKRHLARTLTRRALEQAAGADLTPGGRIERGARSEPHRPAAVREALASQGYLADEALAVAVFLAIGLEQPLLLEGEAGVGKTETAKALAAATGARLIRLQCHEGIDVASALYDWDYPRQLLEIRAAEAGGPRPGALFRREFLIRRPLLEALEHDGPVVLLIDELDRADDEFEAFLLELLAEFQVTIPELGTIAARGRPVVVLTSNRTRELHDALKRRCLYHWIDYPDRPARRRSSARGCPGVPDEIAERVCAAVARLRGEELYKLPGVGETISWARALVALGDEADLDETLGAALKVREDIERVREREVLGGCLSSPCAGAVTASIAELGREMRAPGASVGIGELLGAHRALAAVDPADPRQAYLALRAALCSGARGPRPRSRRRSRAASATEPPQQPPIDPVATAVLPRVAVPEPLPGALDLADPGELRPSAASEVELLREKDFAEYTDAERARARAILARVARRGPTRRGRRTRAVARRGSHPDQRATLRAALRHAGEPLERRWREPVPRPRPLVLVCDVSGSMEPYARMLLAYAHACVQARKRCEAFAFSTRLTRITRELVGRDPDAALAPRGRGGRRLVGRHADRRRDRRAQPRARPPARARRGGRDPLRRLGSRRAGAARGARSSAWPAARTGSCGSTRSRRRPATSRWCAG